MAEAVREDQCEFSQSQRNGSVASYRYDDFGGIEDAMLDGPHRFECRR